MTDYRSIKRNAAVMSSKKLPEGWGRSVVGGVEIITPPSQKAEANPLTKEEIINDMSSDYREEMNREEASYVPDLSHSFEPDSRGYIGDYHIDDLKKQYLQLESPDDTDENLLANNQLINDLNALNAGKYRSKVNKNGVVTPEEAESVRFLGNALKYGRLILNKERATDRDH